MYLVARSVLNDCYENKFKNVPHDVLVNKIVLKCSYYLSAEWPLILSSNRGKCLYTHRYVS